MAEPLAHEFLPDAAPPPPPSAIAGLLSVLVVLALIAGGAVVTVAIIAVLYPLNFWAAVAVGGLLGWVAAPLLAFRAGAPLKEKRVIRHLRWPLIALVGLLFQATVVGAVWEFGGRSVDDLLFTAENAAYVLLDGSDFEKVADKRFIKDEPEAPSIGDAGPVPEDKGQKNDGGDARPALAADGGVVPSKSPGDGGQKQADPDPEAKPEPAKRRRAKVKRLPKGLPVSAVYLNYTGYGQLALGIKKDDFEVARAQMQASGDHRVVTMDKGSSDLKMKWSMDQIWTLEYEPFKRAKAKKRKKAATALHTYMLAAFGKPDDERMIPSGTRLRWQSEDNTVILYLPAPKRGKFDGIASERPWVIMTNNYSAHRKTRDKGF
jgi:hypothetical protein